MHRVVVLLAFACACGRVGFALHDDAGDAGSDAPGGPARSIVLPSGGQMDQVVVGGDGTWYGMSKTGGAFRSSDQGMTWSRCGDRDVRSIAVTSDNVVWAAGADVGRSSDRCATWTDTGNGRFTNMVFADGGTIFAACDNGLRTWNGTQWIVIPTPLDGLGFNWMTRGPQRYFIGTQNGILTSPDATTWTSVTTGFADTSIQAVSAVGNHTYAITAGGPGGISCSDGTGATWSICVSDGGFAIAADPTDGTRVFAGIYDEGIETTDAFASQTLGFREKSMDSALVLGLTFAPSGELILSSDRGVFVAPPGSDVFAPRMTGIDAWDIETMLVAGDDMYLTTRGGPLHSAGGAPFTSTTEGIIYNTNAYAVAEAPNGRIWVAGRSLYESADRGETYSVLHGADGAEGYRFFSILFDGATAYVGSGTRVVSADPPYTTWVGHNFTTGQHAVVALHKSPLGALLVGTSDDGVYVSNDAAATFSKTPGLGAVRVHAFADLADGRVIAGASNGVWQLDASGTTWSSMGLGGYIDGLTRVGDTLFAVGSSGVEYTKDDGATWTPLPGAENLGASDAVLDATTGQLIIGTDSRGLVRVPLP